MKIGPVLLFAISSSTAHLTVSMANEFDDLARLTDCHVPVDLGQAITAKTVDRPIDMGRPPLDLRAPGATKHKPSKEEDDGPALFDKHVIGAEQAKILQSISQGVAVVHASGYWLSRWTKVYADCISYPDSATEDLAAMANLATLIAPKPGAPWRGTGRVISSSVTDTQIGPIAVVALRIPTEMSPIALIMLSRRTPPADGDTIDAVGLWANPVSLKSDDSKQVVLDSVITWATCPAGSLAATWQSYLKAYNAHPFLPTPVQVQRTILYYLDHEVRDSILNAMNKAPTRRPLFNHRNSIRRVPHDIKTL